MDSVEAGAIGEPLLASSPGSPDLRSPKELFAASVKDLPDLTPHIARAGLMPEYLRYRQGYLNWRQGGHRGARGEATESGLVEERQRLGYLEPSEEEWNWRKTISYWIVVFNLEGSFIFLFTSISGCYPGFWGSIIDLVTVETTFVGGTMFGISIYLLCFEVINLQRDEGDTCWNPFTVCRHLEHCRNIGLNRSPYLGGLLYLVGATLFQVELTASLFPSLLANRPTLNLWIVQLPTAIGGFFFFLASLGELLEWLSGRGSTVFFAMANDVAGCALFAVAGFVFMAPPTPNFDPNWVGGMMYTVGSLNFVLGGVSSLVLWRDGNFGLAYSAQLGKLAHHEFPGRFSALSIGGVTGLCLLGTVATMVFFCEVRVSWWNSNDDADYATRTFYPFLIFAIIHIAIALRAAVVNAPTEQPWRGLHKACHVLLAMASVILLAQLADCIWQAQDV